MADDAGEPTEAPVARPKLRVWATVGEAYAIWFANLGLWLKLSIVPVVILIVLNAIAPPVVPAADNVDAGTFGIAAGFFILCYIIIYLSEIPLATAWHRFILTHEDTVSHRYLIGRREWRYFLKALLIFAISIAISIVIGLIATLVMIPIFSAGAIAGAANNIWMTSVVTSVFTMVVYAALAYFLGHLFLMLPAAAVGRQFSTSESRAAVRSNEWRLVGVYIVALIPILIVSTILTWPINGASVLDANDLLGSVPTLVFAPVIIGVVSIAYRELVQKPEAATH